MIEYEKRIHSEQGNYIVTGTIEFENTLIKESIILDGMKIEVDHETTLYGFYSKPIRFCGFLQKMVAVFYLGHGGGDLFFTPAHYYDVTFIIDSNRIGKQYREHTFRDFFLNVDANGSKFWK